jgi:VCBS repeat-containing protein
LQGNLDSYASPIFFADGTKVAFVSAASNLVAGDNGYWHDIFIKDLNTGAITLVDTAADGSQANNQSYNPVFSADGTKVAFVSDASNLVTDDTNVQSDIFVKDLTTGAIMRVNTTVDGSQVDGNGGKLGISADGTKVVFSSFANNLVTDDTNVQSDIFVKDLTTGAIMRVNTTADGSQADAYSSNPAISADGTKVAFISDARNLVLNDTNVQSDIFVKDLITGAIMRVNMTADGLQANGHSGKPVFSADGTKVAFISDASNLVSDDTNGVYDVFVKDLVSGEISRVSTAADGANGINNVNYMPVFSPDGMKVAFYSLADNLVANDTNGATDIFIKNIGSTPTDTGGIDTVQSSITYTLGQYLENLTLTGSANINGTGNTLNNTLIGNSGNNQLNGGLGNDTAIYTSSWLNATITANASTISVSTAAEGVDTLNSIETLILNGVSIAAADAVNDAPIGVNDNNANDAVIEAGSNVVGDSSAVGNVLTNDTDADSTLGLGETKLVSAVAGQTTNIGIAVQGVYGSVVIAANGAYTYTLNNADVDTEALATGQTAIDSFTYTVVDAHGLTGTATLAISISGSNDNVAPVLSIPQAINYSDTFADDTFATANGTLSATDANSGDILRYNIVNSVTNTDGTVSATNAYGKLTLNKITGAYRFVANDTAIEAVNQNASDSFNVTVSDGKDTVSQTLTVNITSNTTTESNSSDSLLGGSGSDRIAALEGNDTLNGGAGADTLLGGKGDDYYFVDNINDVVTELANEGVDTIDAAVNFTLGSNVENLNVHGSIFGIGSYGVGNELNNIINGAEGFNYLTGGAGNDTLHGGEGNDRIFGDGGDTVVGLGNFTGNDMLYGDAGDDDLNGGAGNDSLDGGAGADSLSGGLGNDTYLIDSLDVITENVGEGTDTIQVSMSYTLGQNIENLTLMGVDNFNGTGNLLNNTLIGNSGNNLLDGAAGSDIMQGGAGNDIYMANQIGDVAVEGVNAGVDTVYASLSYLLRENVEGLILTGLANINGTGNSGDNALTGNAGNNNLLAGAGNDTLDGGAGSDTLNGGEGIDVMRGGTGNDTYTVDNINDVVVELVSEGSLDTVNSFVSYTLSANVERLVLAGLGNLDGTGNELDNILTGNNANNHLTGGAGNDTLEGRGGVDTLEGGLGNDLYYVDNIADVVIESAGQGTDKVSSSASYTLNANVEQLFLTGIAGIAGTGNTSNNIIYGNAGNNQLSGGLGNDSLNGGLGNDVLIGGAGNDTLFGGLGDDTYLFGTGSGKDLIKNEDILGFGNDIVLFDAGITADQVWLRKSGNDLQVSLIGTADSFNVQNWYTNTMNRIDSLQLADGKTLLASEVQTLVSAMAAFTPPAIGQTSLTTQQHTALDSVIAASW